MTAPQKTLSDYRASGKPLDVFKRLIKEYPLIVDKLNYYQTQTFELRQSVAKVEESLRDLTQKLLMLGGSRRETDKEISHYTKVSKHLSKRLNKVTHQLTELRYELKLCESKVELYTKLKFDSERLIEASETDFDFVTIQNLSGETDTSISSSLVSPR